MSRLDEVLFLSRSISDSLDSHDWKFEGVVCNPLDYGWRNHEKFLRMAVRPGQRILFLGMNPGPYGMMQTGVPFGEIDAVKNYLSIHDDISSPKVNPPDKKIEGMNIKRHEVSGRKFWKMAADYGSPDDFFSVATVFSFCPLAFIGGKRNITPDELPAEDRAFIDESCGRFLSSLLAVLDVSVYIALGHYAEKRLRRASVNPIYFPHPSPRSPASMGFWDSGEALECFRRLASEA